MSRLLTVVLALLAFVSTALAAGSDYRDPEGRFTITVPEGWTAEKPTMEQIALIMSSPGAPTSGGFCMVIVQSTPETRSISQAELDQGFSKLFNDDFWALSFQAAGYKDVAIETSGSTDQGGHKAFYVVVTATLGAEAGPLKVKNKQVMHAIPGSLHAVNCLAKSELYAQVEPVFEGVFTSFVPKGADLVAQAPANVRSLLTLYSGPRFDGVTRVVSEDTPNLPFTGWSGATASLVVSGFGQWQVCDGLNYAGNCRLVTAANAGGHAIRIGSVRRYLDGRDLRGASGVVTQVVGQAYGVAASRQARRH